MNLYNCANPIIQLVEETLFCSEKDIQKLFENNLQMLTGLMLVKSEFEIKNKRIDTLAFDNESKSFVIIEYKLEKRSGLFDQGLAYLTLAQENKDVLVVEYNQRTGQTHNRDEFDWAGTKIIFVSNEFTDNQLQAAKCKEIAVELWEVKPFANKCVLINEIAKNIKPAKQKTHIKKPKLQPQRRKNVFTGIKSLSELVEPK